MTNYRRAPLESLVLRFDPGDMLFDLVRGESRGQSWLESRERDVKNSPATTKVERGIESRRFPVNEPSHCCSIVAPLQTKSADATKPGAD